MNKTNINQTDENGNTELHYAIQKRKWQDIEKLIINGAEIDIKNKNGISVFDGIFNANNISIFFRLDVVKRFSNFKSENWKKHKNLSKSYKKILIDIYSAENKSTFNNIKEVSDFLNDNELDKELLLLETLVIFSEKISLKEKQIILEKNNNFNKEFENLITFSINNNLYNEELSKTYISKINNMVFLNNLLKLSINNNLDILYKETINAILKKELSIDNKIMSMIEGSSKLFSKYLEITMKRKEKKEKTKTKV